MMKYLLLCALFVFSLFLISPSLQSELPQDLLNSYFDGRSGDIVLYNKDSSKTLGTVKFVTSSQFPATVTSISETQVADLIAHLLSLPPLNPLRSRASFPTSSSFFSSPKANILFHISSNFSSTSQPPSFSIFESSQSFPLLSESYSPTSLLSHLTSIFSGSTPSVHGIIADSWIDRIYGTSAITKAYESWSSSSTPYSANLADMLTLTFSGKSLVLSMAAKKEVARAMSAKPFVLDDAASANFGFYLNGESGVFDSIYPSKLAKVLINKDTVKEFFETETEEKKIPCGLDLENSVDYQLLAEVAFAQKLVALLTVPGSEFHKYISDEVPDFYSLSFGSLALIESKFGRSSEQATCSVKLIDSTMKAVVGGMKKVYGGNDEVLVEGLIMKHICPTVCPKTLAAVNTAVDKVEYVAMESEIQTLWPNLYLSDSSDNKKQMISEDLNKILTENYGLTAEIMPAPLFTELKNSYKLVESLRQAADNSSDISEMEVFQTILWSSIGLGVAALAGGYIMSTIDPSTDTQLYQNDINHPTPKAF